MTYTCNKCDTEKEVSEYRVRPTKRGHSTICKKCESLRNIQWNQNNADRVRAAEKRRGPRIRSDLRLSRKGVTRPQLESMISAQDNKCAICKESLQLFHIDHDHECCPSSVSCGECVRGLLCPACNLGLGQFGDDKGRLQSAIEYLE